MLQAYVHTCADSISAWQSGLPLQKVSDFLGGKNLPLPGRHGESLCSYLTCDYLVGGDESIKSRADASFMRIHQHLIPTLSSGSTSASLARC